MNALALTKKSSPSKCNKATISWENGFEVKFCEKFQYQLATKNFQQIFGYFYFIELLTSLKVQAAEENYTQWGYKERETEPTEKFHQTMFTLHFAIDENPFLLLLRNLLMAGWTFPNRRIHSEKLGNYWNMKERGEGKRKFEFSCRKTLFLFLQIHLSSSSQRRDIFLGNFFEWNFVLGCRSSNRIVMFTQQ